LLICMIIDDNCLCIFVWLIDWLGYSPWIWFSVWKCWFCSTLSR
jgi:hypothetical protein